MKELSEILNELENKICKTLDNVFMVKMIVKVIRNIKNVKKKKRKNYKPKKFNN